MNTILRRSAIATAVIIGAALIPLWLLTRLNPAQETFAHTLQLVDAIADPSVGGGRTFSATLEVLRAKGLPDKFGGARLDVRYAAPDRLRLATKVGDEVIEAGRKGNELWVWLPAKSFAVQAIPDVPLFASNPARLDDTRLAPLAIHIGSSKLSLAPAMFDVQALADEKVDTENGHVLSVTPLPVAKQWLGLGDATLTLWLRGDGFPVRIGYRDAAGKTDALVALHDVKIGATMPTQTWDLPATAGAKVERVALRHLQRFIAGIPRLLDKPKPTPLGPATGERKLIATSGNGRLEMRDGTRNSSRP